MMLPGMAGLGRNSVIGIERRAEQSRYDRRLTRSLDLHLRQKFAEKTRYLAYADDCAARRARFSASLCWLSRDSAGITYLVDNTTRLHESESKRRAGRLGLGARSSTYRTVSKRR